MKPNDKAYQAAIAEGKRWGKNLIRKENQIPSWKVLRQSDKQYGYDVIAGFNNHEDCDEALERLRAEAMVNAAYAAQFQSEDYAGLIERLRLRAGIYKWTEADDRAAADALEAVLAEREALKAENNELREENENIQAANRYGKDWVDNASQDIASLRAERDALAARLAPVCDIKLKQIGSEAIYKMKLDVAIDREANEESYEIIGDPLSYISESDAVIAAIRPHIEAAEREKVLHEIRENNQAIRKLANDWGMEIKIEDIRSGK